MQRDAGSSYPVGLPGASLSYSTAGAGRAWPELRVVSTRGLLVVFRQGVFTIVRDALRAEWVF
jgi:hypothetical protein